MPYLDKAKRNEYQKKLMQKVRKRGTEATAENINKISATLFAKAVTGNNPRWAELWLKRMNLLVERQEIKHKFELSADEHYRIRRDAERRIQELHTGAGGVDGVLDKPGVLSVEVLPVTEPERVEDRQVAAVAVPDRPAEDISNS